MKQHQGDSPHSSKSRGCILKHPFGEGCQWVAGMLHKLMIFMCKPFLDILLHMVRLELKLTLCQQSLKVWSETKGRFSWRNKNKPHRDL